jgi:hypothetical protein
MRRRSILVAAFLMMPAMTFAGELTVSVSSTIGTEADWLLFLVCPVAIGSCNPSTPGAVLNYTIIGEEPAGTYTDQLMLPSNIQSGYLTAIGIATASPPSDVVIGLNNSVSYLGDPWSFSETESQVLNDLVVLDSSDLINFMGNNYSDFIPFSLDGDTLTGAVAEFSDGANVGTFSVGLASVPEPNTGFLVLAGALIGIAKIRCRRIRS